MSKQELQEMIELIESLRANNSLEKASERLKDSGVLTEDGEVSEKFLELQAA